LSVLIRTSNYLPPDVVIKKSAENLSPTPLCKERCCDLIMMLLVMIMMMMMLLLLLMMMYDDDDVVVVVVVDDVDRSQWWVGGW